VTIPSSVVAGAPNQIASTVFNALASNNFLFSDTYSQSEINFSPKAIVSDDAGAGIKYITSTPGYGDLDYAIWGGTLFAQTALNDPNYITDYNINLTPGSKDCNAVLAGYAAGTQAVFLSPSEWWQGFQGWGSVDQSILEACAPMTTPLPDGGTLLYNDGGPPTLTVPVGSGSASVTGSSNGESVTVNTYGPSDNLTGTMIDKTTSALAGVADYTAYGAMGLFNILKTRPPQAASQPPPRSLELATLRPFPMPPSRMPLARPGRLPRLRIRSRSAAG
jgi:hypothetical protein